ncbi:MAG: hypothetical protein ABSD28_00985 [Tepidisphaeraceae bacterium]|jgi:hypothetical protein
MGRPSRIATLLLLALMVRRPALAALPSASGSPVQQTIAAVDSDGLSVLAADLERQAAAALVNPTPADQPRIVTLAACRQFARYFGAIRQMTPDQKETLAWLAAQPNLMPTLMSAVSDRDPPQRVIEILQQLRSSQAANLDDFPDLATALAVVWDKPPARQGDHAPPQLDPQRPAQLFAYFTHPRGPLRFDQGSLCWQLETYIVDLQISDDEILWATRRYANNYSIGSIYFDVNYDEAAFYSGGDKKIAAHAYTLQNILQYGGVCIEQAYFATGVAKSLGIPACICYSRGGGGGGVAHAWVGLLNQINRQPVWDFNQGRYPEDLFWSAEITDPQTHQALTDADVALLAALQSVDSTTRQASALFLSLADLLPPSRRFDLYMREVQLSPGNRPAWVALTDLASKNLLSPAQTDAFSQAVSDFLVRLYPDFACQTLTRAVANRPNLAQVATLDRIALLFPWRPDLKATVRIRQADLLLKINQTDQALTELDDVLTNDLNAGPIVLQAMQRVEKVLRAQHELQRLALVYSRVWPKMPLPERSAYVYSTPYYLVGKHYLALLESLGDQADADYVRNHLLSVIPAGAQLR